MTIEFDRSIPLFWMDEENAGDDPPSEAVVCESRTILDSRLRQLPKDTKDSAATVCIVLGPKRMTDLSFTIPSRVAVDFMMVNKSDADLTIEEFESHPVATPVGQS